MRRGILTIVLLAMVVASAAVGATKVEKPVINYDIPLKSVIMDQSDSRLTLVDEGFESMVPPMDWTIMTTGNSFTWAQSTQANSGAASAFVAYGSIGDWQDEWLVTPALDASALTTVTLEFAEAEAYWADWGLEHNIMVSTTVPDDPAAFTEVLSMTPANHSISSWSRVTVNLNDYAGMDNIYVAFRYQGDYADDWFIDDVRIFEPFEHDVKVAGVVPGGGVVFPGTDINPQLIVENIGMNTESFDVNLVVTRDDMTILDETLNVADLPAGEMATLDYSMFTTEVGVYVLTGTTMLVGDMDTENDTGASLVSCFESSRTPFGILYTEWGCGPCVAANQAMDDWYPIQGNNAAVIRVHVSWPAGNDPMYWANVEQNEYLLAMTPTVVNAVPWLYMDNSIDMYAEPYANWEERIEMGFLMSANTPSPLEVQLGYNPDSGNAEVFVDVLNAIPPGSDYRLFVAVTEDGLELQGPNGEPVHNQTFRWLFPGVEGMPISTDLGMGVYDVPLTLDETWVFENLRAVAWVQEYPGGPLLNCGTIFLTEGVVSIDDDFVNDEVEDNNTPALVTAVKGAHPNPFNPMTTVKFSVARTQHVTLAVYNMSGQRVATLVDGTYEAGEHPVQWNGTDAAGRGVSSGTYLVHMQSEDGVSASKIMLVR